MEWRGKQLLSEITENHLEGVARNWITRQEQDCMAIALEQIVVDWAKQM